MGTQIRKVGGNTYYILGGSSTGGSSGGTGALITIVDTIAARNALGSNVAGFVMVRDATGDPTVHRGWALYLSDTGTWVKAAEEESVDGLWGVKNEILQTVITKRDLETLLKNGITGFKKNDQGKFVATSDLIIQGNIECRNANDINVIPDTEFGLSVIKKRLNQFMQAFGSPGAIAENPSKLNSAAISALDPDDPNMSEALIVSKLNEVITVVNKLIG